MTTGPVEPRGGQDPDPPDLLLAVLVSLRLLRDVADRLEHDHDDGDTEATDMLLRIAALVSVLRRVRRRLEAT